jgi:uridine kinase
VKRSLDEIIQKVREEPAPEGIATKIIAIDGPGGAGKTSLAARLADELGGVPVLHTDDFASPDNAFDWWPRVIDEVLEPLVRNRSVRFRRTDWEDRQRELWAEVEPADFVILEGVSASRAAFQPFLTYSIWIETPRDLRLQRGLVRDGQEARAQWEQWMAQEDGYIERERPQDRADLVVRGDQDLWIQRTP